MKEVTNMTATFKGHPQHESYKKGENYTLEVTTTGQSVHVDSQRLNVADSMYSTVHEFFNNWTNIQVL